MISNEAIPVSVLRIYYHASSMVEHAVYDMRLGINQLKQELVSYQAILIVASSDSRPS